MPQVRAAMELPDAAAVARHRRSAPASADRDEDDEPRRRRQPSGGGFPTWAAVLMGLVLVAATGAGVYLAVRGKGGAKPDPAAGGGDGLGGLLGGPAGPPARYVTGESEKKFEALARDRGKHALTEADVLATMGEPTRKEPNGLRPDARTGRPVAVEAWHWRVQGTGLESTIVMAAGRVQTWVFGVDVGDDLPLEDDPPTRPGRRRSRPADPPDDE